MRIQSFFLLLGTILFNLIVLCAQEELEIDGDAQINGTLNINGTYSFPTIDGDDGQVLQSNGLGIINWVTPVVDDEDWTISGGNVYREFGRVGIGTIAPDVMLDVHGNVELEGPNRFVNFKSTGILAHGLRFFADDVFQGGLFYSPNDKYINLSNNFNTVGLALSLSSNDVGIGTTDPLDQLHIKSITNCDLRLEAAGAKYLRFYEANSQKAAIGHNGVDLLFQNFETNGDLSFNVDGGVVDMVLETGGNVGIGTTSPEYKLDINNGDAPNMVTNINIDVNIEDDEHAYLGLNGGTFAGVVINNDDDAVNAGMIFDYSTDDLAMFTGGSYRMYFKESGLIGINDPIPSAGLHIKQFDSNEEAFALENDEDTDTWSYEIGTNDLFIYFNGSQKGSWNDADGVYAPVSDLRLKKNIQEIPAGTLENLIKLEPKSYYFKDDLRMTEKSFGFIAQEVELIFPEVVNLPETDEHFYTLNYQEIGVLAVQSIKEMNEKVTKLQVKLNEFEKQLEKKDHEIAELRELIDSRLLQIEQRIQTSEE